MSSHREAPEISKDPVADSTDVYAFVSPDKPNTVTLIANYIPLQGPAGGPNFYECGDDVLYEIHIDNNGDGRADISYQFRFTTRVANPDTFLYNTGPIQALNSPNWNRRQTYSVSVLSAQAPFSNRVIGSGLACPPCNIGPLSTPDYAALAAAAVHDLGHGVTVFAGQRAEGFYVDLGAIFDLGNLRPFEQLHNQFGLGVFTKPAPGVNATNHLNVHSIAIQVPKSALVRNGHPTIGIWTTASRQRVRLWDADNGENVDSGPFRQVSRLGNPLVNEVLIPLGHKDQWNSLPPADDKRFAGYVTQPGFSALLPDLYPGVFPEPGRAGRLGKAACGPGGHPADRHTQRHRPRIHQLHRAGAGRHAAAEHLHPAGRQAEHPGPDRRGPGRLPERPPGSRQRGHDRTAGAGRGHVPAGRQVLHTRRGGGRGHRRADPGRRQRPLPRPLPLPGGSLQRLRQPVLIASLRSPA